MESFFTALSAWIQSWFPSILHAGGQFFLSVQPEMAVPPLPWLLTTAAVFALLLALAGLPLICLAAEYRAVRGLGFYDKCSRQLAALLLRLSWALLLLGPASAYVRGGFSTSLPPLPILICLGLVLVQSLCATLYALCWIRRSSRALRALPGLLAAGSAFGLLYAFTLLLHAPGTEAHATSLQETLLWFLPPQNLDYSSLIQIPFLALGIAGGMSAVWLIYRRKKDDFGRDYYTNMLPWCVRWAHGFWLLFWLLLAGFAVAPLCDALWQEHFPELMAVSLRTVPWLLPALIWSPALYSAFPLRHKVSILLGLCLALACLPRLVLSLGAGG